MDMTVKNAAGLSRGPDRRLLDRVGAGRRETDRAAADLLPSQSASALGTSNPAPRYLLLMLLVFMVGLCAVRAANTAFAPMLYDQKKIVEVGQALAGGKNYLTHDLNIETRGLRHAHIANLTRAPYVAVIGGSQWQEAHADLARGDDFYNAHVQGDYYEDILAVPEMFVRYGKLPEQVIISIREDLFTPVADRADTLWVPALQDYRAMAKRLSIAAHDAYTAELTPRLRQSLSLPLLKANVIRHFNAPAAPHISTLSKHPTLDVLLADGSIRRSERRDAVLTRQRARADALSAAYQRRNQPPKIDENGVIAVDKVLEFLTLQGVRVTLAHPPFNPVYWNAVQDSPYLDGVRRIEAITDDFARKYGMDVIGGFDPAKSGCMAEDYIDGEHANARCLGRIVDQFLKLDEKRRAFASVGGRNGL